MTASARPVTTGSNGQRQTPTDSAVPSSVTASTGRLPGGGPSAVVAAMSVSAAMLPLAQQTRPSKRTITSWPGRYCTWHGRNPWRRPPDRLESGAQHVPGVGTGQVRGRRQHGIVDEHTGRGRSAVWGAVRREMSGRSYGQPVAHAADGLDHAVAELAAQVPDVDVDDVGAGVEVVPPHVGQKLFARQHLPGMAEEHLGEGELACRQLDDPLPLSSATDARRDLRSRVTPPASRTVVSGATPSRRRSRIRASSSSNRNGLVT